MMKIYDTSGNELERDEIDFSTGRLLQGNEEDTLVFTTWEELPDENSSVETNPTIEDRVGAIETALEELLLQ
ncbi:hypothetical protein [Pseudobutyrivibrio sp.]|uniref:hypothetical protein n=1 Tax=Pseudobutyrivibrio sp. TaxID=2014367 RepID=UPI001B43B984|nr:hypothetical protein [Pseudobutyrivibrio sp.]MBP3261104.1 hypothetical protein [Pseudobutyrivibrio sp.]